MGHGGALCVTAKLFFFNYCLIGKENLLDIIEIFWVYPILLRLFKTIKSEKMMIDKAHPQHLSHGSYINDGYELTLQSPYLPTWK